MGQFWGREEELSALRNLLNKDSASLVAVYGRRRIGKSRLIEEFGKEMKMVAFAGLPPRANITSQNQLDEFSIQMARQFKDSQANCTDWSDAFWQLSQRTAKGRILIFLDEISWLGNRDPDFLGKLKNAWDMWFKKNPKLILVLCGSVSAWITKNIISSTGFYGRISLKLSLKELALKDCQNFWGKLGGKISNEEKLKVLSVTGGVPKYLEEINSKLSAEENIRHLCFTESGLLFNDFEQIFSETLMRRSDIYGEVVTALSNGGLEQTEIARKIKGKGGGGLAAYLEELTAAGFISRFYAWQIKTGKTSRLSRYYLSDNYLRFYLKYIKPNANKILAGNFKHRSLSALPGWVSIMSLQVENLVLANRVVIQRKLGLYPEEIVCDNPYFQRKTTRQKGCQIDYMIQTKFGGLYVCEVKFSRNIIRKDIIDEVQEKIDRLAVPKNFSLRPVLLHANDVHDEVLDSDYFSHIINLSTLFD